MDGYIPSVNEFYLEKKPAPMLFSPPKLLPLKSHNLKMTEELEKKTSQQASPQPSTQESR